jgi:aminoglycoside 2'-N-acetyltransferase I
MSPTRSGHGLEIRHTADLTPPMLDALTTLLDAAFDDWTPNDTDHTFGGLHAMVWDDARLLAHASLVQRTLLLGDRPSRVGYVEGVAVHPDHRRRGLGAAVMQAVEQVAERAYPLAALSTSQAARGFYEARGWLRWEGSTAVMSPSGLVRTPDDDGGVYVRSPIPLDVSTPIACDWRAGDVW